MTRGEKEKSASSEISFFFILFLFSSLRVFQVRLFFVVVFFWWGDCFGGVTGLFSKSNFIYISKDNDPSFFFV